MSLFNCVYLFLDDCAGARPAVRRPRNSSSGGTGLQPTVANRGHPIPGELRPCNGIWQGVPEARGMDHLVAAVPVLDEGVDAVERLTGVRATPSGSHPGWGKSNVLIRLGAPEDLCYLEFIASSRAVMGQAAQRRDEGVFARA